MSKHYGLVFLFINYKVNFTSVSLTKKLKSLLAIIEKKHKINLHLHASIY